MESDPTSLVLREVAAERENQIVKHGYNAEHDDDHDAGDLTAGAICYAYNGACLISPYNGTPVEAAGIVRWPFTGGFSGAKRISGARKDLIRAAAMIVAEIERLDRDLLLQDMIKDDLNELRAEDDAVPSGAGEAPVED